METEDLFDMKYDLTDAHGYIARHDPTKARLIGELNQKCFMVTSDGPCAHYGVPSRVFCVFPTFIISYVACHGMTRQYDIESHTLGSHDLRCLKYSKLCYYKDDMISKVLSRFQSVNQCKKSEETQSILLRREVKKKILSYHSEVLRENTQKEIYDIQKLRQQLKKDEDEFFLKKQLLESERISFNRERRAFEKEKLSLETELAKYKGIVENCLKEISSYDF
jgi:hypothetical protein